MYSRERHQNLTDRGEVLHTVAGNIPSPMPAYGGARWCVVETEWGWCGLQRGEGGISVCTLPSPERSSASLPVANGSPEAPHDPLLARAACLLVRYFRGEPVGLRLPLTPATISPFALRVLRACAEIPRGETRTYGEIAAAAGSPGGARAAGQALGRNPVPIFVPCHRVIGANRRLTGFASGLDMKARLLDLEGITGLR